MVFSEKPSPQFLKEWSGYYMPNMIYAVAGKVPLSRDKNSDKFKIYVCKNETCFAPVDSLEKVIALIFT